LRQQCRVDFGAVVHDQRARIHDRYRGHQHREILMRCDRAW
jgi:hypothetical protein